MLLEVDVGNSRLKWRLRTGDKVTDTHFYPTSSIDSVEHLKNIFIGVDKALISRAVVASVVPEVSQWFSAWAKQYSLDIVFVEVERQCKGVVNGYEDVSAMGVDRWLALLAASQYSSNCLVIDAGSAITVDLLVGNKHQGGYIVPGLNLMHQSLFRNTGKVQVERSSLVKSTEPGKSTEQAVSSGLMLMLKGLVYSSFEKVFSTAKVAPLVVVTGGDGDELAELLVFDGQKNIHYVPSLVLDGLFVADD